MFFSILYGLKYHLVIETKLKEDKVPLENREHLFRIFQLMNNDLSLTLKTVNLTPKRKGRAPPPPPTI